MRLVGIHLGGFEIGGEEYRRRNLFSHLIPPLPQQQTHRFLISSASKSSHGEPVGAISNFSSLLDIVAAGGERERGGEEEEKSTPFRRRRKGNRRSRSGGVASRGGGGGREEGNQSIVLGI